MKRSGGSGKSLKAKTAFKTVGELAFGEEGAIVGKELGKAIDDYQAKQQQDQDCRCPDGGEDCLECRKQL